MYKPNVSEHGHDAKSLQLGGQLYSWFSWFAETSLLLWSFLGNTHGDGLSVVSSLLSLGGLLLSGLLLVGELLLSDLLLLHLVDGLNEDGLVLELVTLGGEVEVVVDVGRDLLGLSELLQQSSQDSLSSHPLDLDWKSGVSGSSPLAVSGVSALSLGLVDPLDSGSGVHLDLASHDESILVQLSDVLSCKRLID